MGLRNPRTQQEDPNLARNLPHRRDGGACTRRRRLSSPWQVGLLKLRRLGLAAKSSRFRRYERDPEGRRRSGGPRGGGGRVGGVGTAWKATMMTRRVILVTCRCGVTRFDFLCNNTWRN
ncbi:hypothetical protein LINPERPRIM_LOCUS12127 [Linum perenne]